MATKKIKQFYPFGYEDALAAMRGAIEHFHQHRRVVSGSVGYSEVGKSERIAKAAAKRDEEVQTALDDLRRVVGEDRERFAKAAEEHLDAETLAARAHWTTILDPQFRDLSPTAAIGLWERIQRDGRTDASFVARTLAGSIVERSGDSTAGQQYRQKLEASLTPEEHTAATHGRLRDVVAEFEQFLDSHASTLVRDARAASGVPIPLALAYRSLTQGVARVQAEHEEAQAA
ncbi:MAG: hypothetical protein M0R73_12450 [Dehalococcoidia bacterium]|nr:hypothetical protein [Dehalococcoidia bacterium]